MGSAPFVPVPDQATVSIESKFIRCPPNVRPHFLAFFALTACAHHPTDHTGTVEIPAGPFWMGSDLDERSHAVTSTTARDPSDRADQIERLHAERPRARVDLSRYWIMQRPVTNADYFAFVLDTDAPAPWVDEDTWRRYATGYDHALVQRMGWPNGRPTPERADHPVVLVAWHDAVRYCDWWGERRGGEGRIPSEAQWEKAARGTDGRPFPWGDAPVAGRANTREAGYGDLIPAGSSAAGASAYGVADMAGNVLEWTRTAAEPGTYIVKGGAWNTDVAAARAAARHARPRTLRHVAIGFRCVLEP